MKNSCQYLKKKAIKLQTSCIKNESKHKLLLKYSVVAGKTKDRSIGYYIESIRTKKR